MINKEHLWFLTLFSLILVLSVYYITMPNDLLLSNQVFKENDKSESDNVAVEVVEDDILVSLRLDKDEERENEKKTLQSVLTNTAASIDEKNEAYEKLTYLNNVYGEEEKLEKKVKECCDISSFIEVNNNEINVVGISKNHSVNLANKIMRAIQEEYPQKVNVTVSFK
ncbi:MAG: SpoIIIAH-like family protein [Bacilli bacterium]|nr:SpoIIIAH-like family protein [Bacilli bacterium]